MPAHVRIPAPLILASGSPRRSELLARMGLAFTAMPADVDETMPEQSPEGVRQLAVRKARAALTRLKEQGGDGVVLAADTIVWCEGKILGKPVSRADAEAMLRLLSGRWHEVYTGVCALEARTGREETFTERTRVHMVELSAEAIREYIAGGEPMDKAGAYAIQGAGGMFVDQIEGSPSNVMGLPMAQTLALLERFARSPM